MQRVHTSAHKCISIFFFISLYERSRTHNCVRANIDREEKKKLTNLLCVFFLSFASIRSFLLILFHFQQCIACINKNIIAFYVVYLIIYIFRLGLVLCVCACMCSANLSLFQFQPSHIVVTFISRLLAVRSFAPHAGTCIGRALRLFYV